MRSAEDEYRPFPNRARKNLAQRWFELPVLTKVLGLRRGVRLLEVGCGRGIALAYFQERLRPTRLVGLDIDSSLLAEAQSSWKGGAPVELVWADVRAMPLSDASIDLVVDFGTLFHIARPERAVREIARVLSPGGLFVHETWASQLISHPLHLLRRRALAPWEGTTELMPRRTAGFWETHEWVRRAPASRAL